MIAPAATEEQAVGTTQVVKAMERMQATIQRNTARVTQLAASAAQLANQSTVLQGAVAQFVTENGHGAPTRTPRS